MFLKKTRHKSGRVQISLVHGYREPGTNKVKHRVVENLGYVDQYEHLYEDPIAHFEKVARRRTLAIQEEKKAQEIFLGSVSSQETMNLDEHALYHLGFLPLSSIYHELKIHQFIINRQRSLAMDYSLNDVMQLLLYTRILTPGSKKANYEEKKQFARPFNCDQHDLYRALDYFANFSEELLLHLHEQVRIHYQRKTHVVFYDVTNYYFEIDKEDELRRKGYCKDNTGNPIVQMGLLLDADAIPISFRLFQGNTHDSQTMLPILESTRQDYGLGRLIMVADKALNSGDNVAFLMAKGDGFIFSQKIRGAGQDLQAYVLDQAGYQEKKGVVKNTDGWDKGPQPAFRMKSRPYPQAFWVTHADDVKRKIPLDVKQIVCYNDLYARRQQYKRAELLLKAQKIVNNPKAYNKKEASGALRYVKNIEYDPQTGECLKLKKMPYLDIDKIKEDEKYDGYYVLITSEIAMPDVDVARAYHDLWQIEDSFRITKTTLVSQPVYLSLANRIQAHFLTCFMSLLLLRLLCKRLDGAHCPEQVVGSLRQYRACFIKDNVYKVTYYDEILRDIGSALDLQLDRRFLRSGDMKQLVAKTKKKK